MMLATLAASATMFMSSPQLENGCRKQTPEAESFVIGVYETMAVMKIDGQLPGFCPPKLKDPATLMNLTCKAVYDHPERSRDPAVYQVMVALISAWECEAK